MQNDTTSIESPLTTTEPILSTIDIHRRFPLDRRLFGTPKHFLYAVNGVSLALTPGKTIGLVGESGSGKSTVGKMICSLEHPDAGDIRYREKSILDGDAAAKQEYHRTVQMIFQNPYTSLNPRQRVSRIFREIFHVHKLAQKQEVDDRIADILEQVGLPAETAGRYPFEFSGGQRQRLCIARALTVDPEVVVCDEPVSALDVSIQAQILQLLEALQNEKQLAYLFISHDLSVVYHICDEVLIMYMGRIVERGPVRTIFDAPAHPYTKALISAIPVPDPETKRKRIILSGEIPSARERHPGCAFYSRCASRMDVCQTETPPLIKLADGHEAECWLHKNE